MHGGTKAQLQLIVYVAKCEILAICHVRTTHIGATPHILPLTYIVSYNI